MKYGLRSDSLFIEQKRQVPSKQSEKHPNTQNNIIPPTDTYETRILDSRIINETTIAAWYDPLTVTSDLLNCNVKKENESPTDHKGISPKRINVGRK